MILPFLFLPLTTPKCLCPCWLKFMAFLSYICSACTTAWNVSWELGWKLKNTRTQTDGTGTLVVLDIRMPTLLCSREAYIGILS